MEVKPEVKPNAIYSVPEMSELLRVTGRTVQRWCQEGRLPAWKLPGGRRWFAYGKDLLALNQEGRSPYFEDGGK